MYCTYSHQQSKSVCAADSKSALYHFNSISDVFYVNTAEKPAEMFR